MSTFDSVFEDLCRTYWAAKGNIPATWDELVSKAHTFPSGTRIVDEVRAGMRAVLRKHVEPMIAEAFSAGTSWKAGGLYATEPRDYAARIIAKLTVSGSQE